MYKPCLEVSVFGHTSSGNSFWQLDRKLEIRHFGSQRLVRHRVDAVELPDLTREPAKRPI